MRRGRPLSSIPPSHMVKPFRDQFSPAEELRQDLEQQWAEEFALADLEPDWQDVYPEDAA